MEAKDIRNRNRIRKILESKVVEEDGCDASKLYIKKLFRLNPIARYEDSRVIEVGEYKWTFIAREIDEGTLQFELLADIDNNPRLKIYALITIAIIHHSDPLLTNCTDRFHSVSKAHRGYILHLERAREEGFLDPKDNVQVELQIQMFGKNVFQPLLVKKYRAELLLTKMHFVNMICSSFFKKTVDNLKSLIDNKNKWQSFRTFVEESDQISKDQMFWEEQDVIQKALVNHFFVDGILTSPLLMEILYIGYTSINANSTTAKFVKIEEDRFGLVGVPSLFTEVVGREYKPISESILREFCCMIVEMFALDWIFRHKIRGNFTQSELNRTEKKSRRKVKKTGKTIVLTVIPITPKRNDKCVEEMEQTQNDESSAADLEEDLSVLDTVRADLNDLVINAGIEDHNASGGYCDFERNKIRGNFTRIELNRTEKKSRKKVKETGKTISLMVIPIAKRNDKCVEEKEQTQNDESIATDLEEDLSVLDTVRADLNDLVINAGIEDHNASGQANG